MNDGEGVGFVLIVLLRRSHTLLLRYFPGQVSETALMMMRGTIVVDDGG